MNKLLQLPQKGFAWLETLSRFRKSDLPPQQFDVLRLVLICLGGLAALLVGCSGLFFRSTYAPLVIGAGIFAIVVFLNWIGKPVRALYVAIFVVFIPLDLIPPGLQSQINRSMAVIAFLLWGFDLIVKRRRLVINNTMIIFLCFLLWSILTTFWANFLSISITTLQVYLMRFIVFLFLVPNEIRTHQDLDGLMDALAAIGWMLVFVSIGALLTNGYTPGTRFQVFSMNQNEMGIYLLLTVPGIFWQFVKTPQRNQSLKIFLTVIYLILIVALIAMSGSRGSILSLAITLLAFYLFGSTRKWGIVSLILLVGLAAAAPLLFTTILERFAVTSGDTMLGGREVIWQAGWNLARDHLWSGVGIGNAPFSALGYLQYFESIANTQKTSLHNPVLTILAETGIPGLVLYLSFLLSALVSFGRAFFKSNGQRPQYMTTYFALTATIFCGYMVSWIKGGGMESDYSYYLVLALLVLPENLAACASEPAPSLASESVPPDAAQAPVRN
jgi:O-antigen ligase